MNVDAGTVQTRVGFAGRHQTVVAQTAADCFGNLRNEFGMKGIILTDFSNSNNYMDVVQGVVAGGNAWDANDANKWPAKLKEYKDNATVCNAMRDASKHILYTVANSNAMNGVSENVQIVEKFVFLSSNDTSYLKLQKRRQT